MFKTANLFVLICLLAMPAAQAAKLTPQTTAMRVPTAPPGDSKSASILVIENREEVLEGDKRESYEGVSRELYGIPLPRVTNDETTMAAYLGQRLKIGFDRAGYNATFVDSPKASKVEDRIDALEVGANTLIFVVDMRDWHYDFGGFKPSFLYDVTVYVYGDEKQLLAKKDFSGTELMPKGGWKHFKVRYAELYQTIFDRIFDTSEIKQALDGKASTTRGTIEQRLTQLQNLLDQGLIDQAAYDREKARIISEI